MKHDHHRKNPALARRMLAWLVTLLLLAGTLSTPLAALADPEGDGPEPTAVEAQSPAEEKAEQPAEKAPAPAVDKPKAEAPASETPAVETPADETPAEDATPTEPSKEDATPAETEDTAEDAEDRSEAAEPGNDADAETGDTEGTSEDASEGTSEDTSEGTSDDTADDTADDTSDGTAEDTSANPTDDTSDDTSDDTADAQSEDEAQAEDTADEADGDAAKAEEDADAQDEADEAPAVHKVYFSVTGDEAVIRVNGEAVQSCETEADTLTFAVDAAPGSVLSLVVANAEVSSSGDNAFTLADMGDVVTVDVGVTARTLGDEPAEEYTVTFSIAEGATVTVNGQEIADGGTAETEDRSLTFSAAAIEGYEITNVEAKEATLTPGEGDTYTLTDIEGDVNVAVEAAPLQTFGTTFSCAAEDGSFTVTVTAPESAEIPADATLVAGRLGDDYAADVRAAYEGIPEDAVLTLAALELRLEYEGEAVQPSAPVEVEIRFNTPVEADLDAATAAAIAAARTADAENTDTENTENENTESESAEAQPEIDISVVAKDVLHITSEGREKLDAEVETDDGDLLSARFTTASFSPFVTFTATQVTATEPETEDDPAYPESRDLAKFLTDYTLTPSSKYTVDENGAYVLQPGVEYTLEMTFKENGDLQFDDEELYMQLPVHFGAASAGTTITENFEMQVSGYSGLYDQNVFTISPDSLLTVKWDQANEEAYAKLLDSGTAAFTVRIRGIYNGTEAETWPLGSYTLDVIPDTEHGVELSKEKTNLYYSKDQAYGDDGEKGGYVLEYKVTVKSVGANRDFVLTDAIESPKPGTLLLLGDTISVKRESDGAEITEWKNLDPSITDTGFTLSLPQLDHNETYTVTYKCIVPAHKLENLTVNENGGLGTADDATNTVSASASDHSGTPLTVESASLGLSQIMSPPSIKKTGKQDLDRTDAVSAIVTWTVTGEHRRVDATNGHDDLDLAGLVITDTLGDAPGHEAYLCVGDGITISATDLQKTKTNTVIVPWDTRGLTLNEDKNGWTLEIGTDLSAELVDGLVGEVNFDIKYDTEISMDDASIPFTVTNTVNHAGGTATVSPVGDQALLLQKQLEDYRRVSGDDGDVIEAGWLVKISVPAQGEPGLVLTDTYPKGDTLKAGSVSITGLEANEDYDLDTSDAAKLVVRFKYQNVDGDTDAWHDGLYRTDQRRWVYVRLTTVARMPESGGGEKHENVAFVESDRGRLPDEKAHFLMPLREHLNKKVAAYEAEGEVVNSPKGKYRYVFTYAVDVTGVMGPFTVKDTFDEGLEFLSEGAFHGYPAGATVMRMEGVTDDSDGKPGDKKVPVTAKVSGNTLTLVVTDMPRDGDANHGYTYYSNYRVVYHMALYSDYPSLSAIAGADESGELVIGNTATSTLGSSTVRVETRYATINKELTNPDDVDRETPAHYRLEINDSGLDLNPDSKYLTLVDAMSDNLAVDFESMVFEVYDSKADLVRDAAAEAAIRWDFSGTTGTFTLPDERYIVIEYDATVVGDSVERFTNTATLQGQSRSVESWADVSASAFGVAGNASIVLYKYAGENMAEPLSGVRFRLYDDTGRQLRSTRADGCFVTDSEGKALIQGSARTLGWWLEPNEDGVDEDGNVVPNAVRHEYRLVEVDPPQGYRRVTTQYRFSIASDGLPDYGDYIYMDGDVLKIRNWPENGMLTVTKVIDRGDGVKLSDLSAEDRRLIKFTLTDAEGNTVTDASGLEVEPFSLADMTVSEDGLSASLDLWLKLGAYKLVETDGLHGTAYERTYRSAALAADASDAVGAAKPDDGEVTFTLLRDEGDSAEVTFTNRYKKKTGVEVHKVWKDPTGEVIDPDAEVTVALERDGEATGDTLTLTKGNGYRGTFTDLPAADADGNAYAYTVSETAPEGWYLQSAVGSAEEGYTLTNKQVSDTVGDVVIAKSFTGIEALPSSFALRLSYQLPSDLAKPVDLTRWPTVLREGDASGTNPLVWTLDGLPIGTVVTVTESGYTDPAYDVETYVLTAEGEKQPATSGTATVAKGATDLDLVNEYARKYGHLTVTKAISDDIGTEAATLEERFEGQTFAFVLSETSRVDASGVGEVRRGTLTYPDPLVFDQLPVGEYTLYEDTSALGAVSSWTFDEAALTDPENVEIVAEGGRPVAKFTVTEDGDAFAVTAENRYISSVVPFRKLDLGDQRLPGATLAVLDKTGRTVIDRWTTEADADGSVADHEVRGLVYGETYILREERSPDGYTRPADKRFVVLGDPLRAVGLASDNGVVLVRNTPTDLRFAKVDPDGTLLAGATLRLLDANDNIIDEWTTATTPHAVTGRLVVGERYTLKELSAPKGHAGEVSVTFTVKADGSPEVTDAQGMDAGDALAYDADGALLYLAAVNRPLSITVRKRSPGGNPVIGATLALSAEDGAELDRWTTEGDAAHALPALENGATYTVSETGVPTGYLAAPDVTFTLTELGELTDVTGADLSEEDGALILTLTDPKAVTELSGTKTWLDGDNVHDSSKEVKLTLTRSIEGGESETVDAAPAWDGDTYTYTDLETHDDFGNAYAYEVSEDPIDGFKTIPNGNDFTNLRVGTVDVKGEKTWLDGFVEHDSSKEVTLTLTRLSAKEGAEAETLDLTPEWDGDDYTYADLDEFDEYGYAYTYAVAEAPIDGFKTIPNGNDFTNLRVGTTDISGKKTWVDDIHSHVSADEVILTLTRLSAKPGSTAEVVSAKPVWTGDEYAYTGLTRYDEEGYEYAYTVAEAELPAYDAVRTATDTGFDFTNTYRASGSIALSARKTLTGRTLAAGEFSFTLYDADGNALSTAKNAVDGSVTFDAIAYTEADLVRSPIAYTIREDVGDVPAVDYDDRAIAVTVTLTDDGKGHITATADRTGSRAAFVNAYHSSGSVALSAHKTLTGRTLAAEEFSFTVYDMSGKAVATGKNAADGTIAFSEIAFTEADVARSPIAFTIREDGGSAQYVTYADDAVTVKVTLADDGKGHITATADTTGAQAAFVNAYVTPTPSPTPTPTPAPVANATPEPVIDFTGTKVWVDEGNAYNTRPDAITLTLYANGSPVGATPTWSGTSGDTWTYTYANLPAVSADGSDITYTVREDPVTNYVASVSGSTITNRLVPRQPSAYTDLEGVKTWNDGNNAAGLRPAHITVRLLQNGVAIDARTVTSGTDWRYSFTHLPVDDGYGHTYEYTVREDGVSGYFARYDGPDIENSRLVNTPGEPGEPGEGTEPDAKGIVSLAVPERNSGTPGPEYESFTDEELEELFDLFGYGTPLAGIYPTGDETPAWPFACAGVGLAALAAALLLRKRRREN